MIIRRSSLFICFFSFSQDACIYNILNCRRNRQSHASQSELLEKLTGQQRNVLQKFVGKLVSMFGNEDATAKKEYFDKFGGEFRAIFKDVAREADSIAEQFKAALDTSQKAEKNRREGRCEGVEGYKPKP